jgi:hypothetical protein
MKRYSTAVALTWPQFGVVCGIGALAGATVGVPAFIVTQLAGTPWQDALALIPFVVFDAAVVSFMFALVGGVIGGVPILLMRRLKPHARAATWVIVGGLAGAAIGALHPFVILFAITEYLGVSQRLIGALPLVALTGASGTLSGLLIGWWYKLRVIDKHPREAIRSTVAVGRSAV